MAIRTRTVQPDMGLTLRNGETIGVVSLEALQEDVAAVVASAYFQGGIVQVVQDRHPTGVPHEMVTVAALIQWQDRTDAKPQPEPAVPAERIEAPSSTAHELLERDAAALLQQAAAELGLEVTFAANGADPEPEELEAELEAEAAAREDHGDVPLPAEAVVMGAPVGAPVGPAVGLPAAQAETRVARQEGEGAGALPFQKGDQPGDPPRQAPDAINLADIARGDASSLPRGDAIPAPGASDDGIDDGLVPEADEDVDSVPEHLR
jgi:hypothetical protein